MTEDRLPRTTKALSQHDSNAKPFEFIHEVCRRLALKHDTVRHADGADLAARGGIDLHFFVAEYDAASKIGHGGGLEGEGEDIEVLELPFAEALAMIGAGVIQDGKTIMLLQYAALNLFK